MWKSGAFPGQNPPPGPKGWGGESELGLRTSILVLTKPPLSSSGHREGQQQGSTQAQHCWSCGELEGMG